MISMITEQLQKQSLEDLKCKSFSISLPLPDHPDAEGCSSPYHFVTEDRSWGLLSHCPRIELEDGIRLGCHHHSSLSLHFPVFSRENSPHRRSPSNAPEAGNSAAPPAPPTKRHCRSLSVPEDLSRWRPVWRPSGSKVWTPVKRRCNSGGVGAVLGVQTQSPSQGVSSLRFQNDPGASIRCIQANSPPFFSLALCRESPGPYTLSPTSVFWDNTEGQSCFPLQRRFSLSPVLIKDAGRFLPSSSGSPPSTPELLRRQQCLTRSQSQPCDLDTRKCGIKRRHQEEDTRWHRPSLDFYKMNQNAGAMCFLDNSDEGSSSPFMACHRESPCTTGSPVTICTLALREEDIGRRDHASCPQAMLFQRDFADLDLNLIEEN
ncbi:protein FAM53C [Spea bombifrons]|uniref:protein FAM53C n=1 Tax=Spea bombifrons TaxID=233779 RepID=UPI0023490D1E|nr:protein FAM53C [Spea bombifrons]